MAEARPRPKCASLPVFVVFVVPSASYSFLSYSFHFSPPPPSLPAAAGGERCLLGVVLPDGQQHGEDRGGGGCRRGAAPGQLAGQPGDHLRGE